MSFIAYIHLLIVISFPPSIYFKVGIVLARLRVVDRALALAIRRRRRLLPILTTTTLSSKITRKKRTPFPLPVYRPPLEFRRKLLTIIGPRFFRHSSRKVESPSVIDSVHPSHVSPSVGRLTLRRFVFAISEKTTALSPSSTPSGGRTNHALRLRIASWTSRARWATRRCTCANLSRNSSRGSAGLLRQMRRGKPIKIGSRRMWSLGSSTRSLRRSTTSCVFRRRSSLAPYAPYAPASSMPPTRRCALSSIEPRRRLGFSSATLRMPWPLR